MKNYIKLSVVLCLCVASFLIIQKSDAQDARVNADVDTKTYVEKTPTTLQTEVNTANAVPLKTLTDEYVNRITTLGTKVKDATIVNPDAITQRAVVESIDTVSRTVDEVQKEKKKVVTDIKDSIKNDIDNSIIEIRKDTQKPAYELQRAVDDERTVLFENLTQSVEAIKPTDTLKIKNIETQTHASLQKIQDNLQEQSDKPVNFEKSKRDVRETLLKFEEVLQQKKDIINSREGDLVFEDSDGDGVSDYDEIYIYKTDPQNAYTSKGSKNDGEKIKEGLNPLVELNEKIRYTDPRQDFEAFVTENYKVNKVQLIKEEKKSDTLVFEGVALPNSYVTLYIYSTPIIVTVKTDNSGVWNYELDQEIENGEHQMYVATVDNSGKIVAKSNPVLFTKTAEAASIGIAGTLNSSMSTENFLKDNFILITLALLIAIIILAMMFVGNHKNIKSVVNDLRNEVK